jgi:hypothetical protein
MEALEFLHITFVRRKVRAWLIFFFFFFFFFYVQLMHLNVHWHLVSMSLSVSSQYYSVLMTFSSRRVTHGDYESFLVIDNSAILDMRTAAAFVA